MIHVFSMSDLNIVLDIVSGSVHIVDDNTSKVLKEFDSFFSFEQLQNRFGEEIDKKELEEIYKEVETLYYENTLYTRDNFEELYKQKPNNNIGIKAMCLNVAHDCNLRCEYCFAAKGDYNTKKELMSVEVGKKALLYLAKNSGTRQNIEVDFFGGEPLMNFEAVKEMVKYGKEIEKEYNKTFHFTITTNGTLLDDDKIDYINEYMDNVVISLDGRKEVHDNIRYYANKKGSYDQIVPMAQKLIKNRDKNKSYYMRGTFTSRNLDFSNDVMHIHDLGFDEISIEPVVGKGEDFHIKEDDLETILKEYEKLAGILAEKLVKKDNLNFYHFNAKLYDGPCIYKRIASCGAGFEYFAVAPSGDIYPCHQFVGEEGFVIGNVDEGITDQKMVKYFHDSNVFSKEECKTCWARYFCSGGCHAHSYFHSGDIRKVDSLVCEMQKKRIECSLMLEVTKMMLEEV